MQFKGRTVLGFIIVTMLASVLVTLVVADKLLEGSATSPATSVASAAENKANHLTKEELEKLNTVLSIVETNYVSTVKREDLIDGAVSGIMASLNDPYSVYMKKSTASQFSSSIEGSFSGIGAEVSLNNGFLTVVSPIKGSPAERGGLLPKDIILSVNGESLMNLTLQEAVSKLRGEKGTKATLEVRREGVSDPISIVLIRDDIDIETVYSEINNDGIGVITITQFSMNTAERFKEELASLEAKKLKGLVIDVRNNPGGVLQGVTEIAQLMIDEGKVVVQVEGRDGKREKTYAKGGEQKDYPIAVLTNSGSASASEILAGALKESAGATVIGEQTYGKGTVQVSYGQALKDGSLIKMTVAKWLTPNGNWIDHEGVAPNIEVKPADVYSVARIHLEDELMRGELEGNIKSMQVMLKALGYTVDRQDGYFSDATEAALKAFQNKEGLKQSGILDEATVTKLHDRTIEYISNPLNDVQLQKAIKVVAGKK